MTGIRTLPSEEQNPVQKNPRQILVCCKSSSFLTTGVPPCCMVSRGCIMPLTPWLDRNILLHFTS